MKHLILGGALLLASLTARAQTVRYSTQGHLPIETQPSMGYELASYLSMGDSVQVVSSQPTDNPDHIADQLRRQYVYVSYPAYHGQPAGQGWVIRRALVNTRDSLLIEIPAVKGQTLVSTQTVTTRRYVPVTEVGRHYVAGGKVVRTVATGRATPKAPVTGGAVAYYCASGNTVKYHASPGCRGLNRCSASVEKMALSRAQQEMDACKICH